MNHNTMHKSLRRAAVGVIGLTLTTVAVGVSVTGCSDEEGSGDIATLSMTDVVNPEVTALTVLDDFDVYVTVDVNASQAASLTIDDNLINNTDFWIDDGMLFVGWDDLVGVEPTKRPVLTLTVREFESVDNRSDALVSVNGVDAYDFEVRSHGDGVVDVTGQATTLDISAAGDSSVDLANLVAERVDLVSTGNGELRIHATQKVTGDLTADGDVQIYGHPDTSQVDVSGDGEIVFV